VKGAEFLRKIQHLARRNGMSCTFVPAKGKGSHGNLCVGSACTTLKDRKKEIGVGLLRAMCKDLGIDPREL
jgi:mRNA interferase HicA